jgi:hypothetical protein
MGPIPGLKTVTDQVLLDMSLEILDIEVNNYYINDDDDNNTCPLFCVLLFYAFLL